MVAQETLDLLVKVRVLEGQPFFPASTQVGAFSF